MNPNSTSQLPDLHVAIMAGGGGTRFWPLSTRKLPKQFLDVLGLGRTLLQMAFDRALLLVPNDRIWVITADDYVPLVQSQLPELDASHIVGEPYGRNTAPCLTLAAHLIETWHKGAVMLAMPSDHLIANPQVFSQAVLVTYPAARQGTSLCAIAVKPTRPETGYGYIQLRESTAPDRPVLTPALSFHEKPNSQRALEYMNDGAFVWNTGIFLWRCDYFLAQMARFAPDISEPFRKIDFSQVEALTPSRLAYIYDELPARSVDYALMERDTPRMVCAAPLQWSDLGAWAAVPPHSETDSSGNTVGENLIFENTSRCLARIPQGKIAAIAGLNDYAVVLTDSALLIAPLGDDDAMRNIYAKIEQQGLDEFL